MEEIYDLLGPRSGVSGSSTVLVLKADCSVLCLAFQLAKKLDVRTNALGENVIPDLSIREISTVTEFESLYR